MALPAREIENWIRNEFGWVDDVHYPLEITEYLENCEIKLRKIIHSLSEQFDSISHDLRMFMNRTRFDLTCNSIEMQKSKLNYQCKINLTYDVEFHWLTRPNHYTNYYSIEFMHKLTEEGINFVQDDIKWLSDESNGQMFGQLFQIDFSKEISEQYAQELCNEFKKLNG